MVNLVQRIQTPPATQRQLRAISQEDFLAILATTEGGSSLDKRDRAVILLLADSGCRAGSLCRLRLGDLRLDECEAAVVERWPKPHVIMFTETTACAIRDWLKVRPTNKGNWLFTGFGSQDTMSPSSLRQMLKRRGKRASVAGPHNPYAFRHAFAIAYLTNGGDLASLADILGHYNVMVTGEFHSRFIHGQLREKHTRHSPVARIFGSSDVTTQATPPRTQGMKGEPVKAL